MNFSGAHATAALPPIEELLPHRGTMRLVDRLADYAADRAVVEYTPQRTCWYADENGDMPAWFGIELMAQAVAAHVAMGKRLAGSPVKLGALLGTRSYRASASRFVAERRLDISAHEVFRDESGLAAYDCLIACNGQVLATSTLKVFEPVDFQAFMQGEPT